MAVTVATGASAIIDVTFFCKSGLSDIPAKNTVDPIEWPVKNYFISKKNKSHFM